MDDALLKKLQRAMDRVSDDELLPALLEETRETQINIRITKAQKQQLQGVTKALGTSMSDYLMTLHTLALPRLKGALKARKR